MTEYGAYSPRKVYSVEDMRDLVEYARIRGVKIVAEFDAPAHAGKLDPGPNFLNITECETQDWPMTW